MASIYTDYREQLQNYFVRRDELRIHAEPGQVMELEEGEAAELAASPGGRVLAGVAQGTIQELFQSFCDVFTDGQFTWIGNQGITSTRVLETLDGDRNSGECAILATALWALWACPRPFGLGQRGATIISFTNDDEDNGFISPHPPGGIRGLLGNIRHPHGEPGDPRNCLYAWGNHKVLSHGGRYYDPSYRQAYEQTREMVAFEYTGRERRVNNEHVVEIRAVNGNVQRGWRPGDRMYLLADPFRGMMGPYRAIGGWADGGAL